MSSDCLLYVDRDREMSARVQEVLPETTGSVSVITERSVDDALDAIVERRVDCVASTVELAGGDGIELLRAVREEWPDLPFVLFPDDGSEALASEAVRADATDYVRRNGSPFETLSERVETVLEERNAVDRQQMLVDAIESAQEGISIIDGDGRFVYVNDAYADLYRYDPGDLVGEHWSLIYPDGEVAHVRDEIFPQVSENGEWRGTTTGLRSDGTTFVERHGLATTASGHVVCTVRDVTERREREAELASLARRYEGVFENPLTLMGLLSPDGTLLEANETALDVAGATAEDVAGRKFWNTPWWDHSEELQDDLRQWIDSAADGDHVHYEAVHPSADGIEIAVDGFIHPVRDADGTITELVAIARDVTERERHRETLDALHESTRQFMRATDGAEVGELAVETAREVLGQSQSGVWFYDADAETLRPVVVSEDGQDVVGEIPAFRPGESLAWQVFEAGETRYYERISERPDSYNPDGPIESEVVVPLGEFGVMISGATEPDGFTETDVSLARVLGETVTAALDRAEREATLRDRRRELERQNERLEQFASIVSHDLRNPLQVLRGAVEEMADGDDSPELERAERSVDRMEQLVDDLLALSRHGDSPENVTSIPLSDLAENCWSNVATSDADIEVTTDLSVRADESRLKQLLENLFTNAVEHAGPDVSVTVGDLPDGFYVADDGPGIPPEKREAMFETGYSTAEDGIGLGLAIVADVAEAHGWDVAVDEAEAGGARFLVTGVEPA